MFDDYLSSYKKILEKSGKYFMGVKRKHKFCIRTCKTLNNLNPSFMREIFELRLSSRPVRELAVPRKRQVAFGTKSLRSLGPKFGIIYLIIYSRTLRTNATVPPVVARCVSYRYDKSNIIL